MKQFKPQLLPNNIAGQAPNWEARITHPIHWLYSNKLDGGRVELFANGKVLGRSLKPITSIHIQQMAKDTMDILQLHSDSIIEAEFFSEEMNFAEIMHFFRSEDVTSDSTLKKYLNLWKKTGGQAEKGWPFPGRSVEWLTTWHDSLKFYAFGIVNAWTPHIPFSVRVLDLVRQVAKYTHAMGTLSPDLVMIQQNNFEHIDALYQAYDQSIIDGYEGLVLMHKDSSYKFGRHTLNDNLAFKIKEDNLEYDGKILEVEESTLAKEGSEKTINELGRSKTSQLKDDREPSGMAKGFLVLLDDGQTMSVSLTGFNHPERIDLLNNPEEYVGKWIKFTAMAPVKVGGRPRGPAHFTKGNVRDDK